MLSLLVMFALLAGQGYSAAAAICQHRDAVEHVAARASQDRAVAAAAFGEETAASHDAKKGSASASPSFGPLDMVPPTAPPVPLTIAERVVIRVGDEPLLSGRSVAPLLEPPAA